jgi:hypothetical protein
MGGWDRPFVGQESTYCMGTITTGTRTEQMDGDGWTDRSLAKGIHLLGTITTGTRTEQMDGDGWVGPTVHWPKNPPTVREDV